MSSIVREADASGRRLIWDWPLRVCHWLLVLALPAAYVTAQSGGVWADWHARIGGLVLALLVFRITWGFLGTKHARFRDFLPTPRRLRTYFRGEWDGLGHNPLGALAVLAMLATLLFQVGTGLFANDDIAFSGPLQHWVSKPTSDALSGWHLQGFNVLLALVGLHLAAICFYAVVKRRNLVGPMLTGRKKLSRDVAAEAAPLRPLHLFVALAAALAIVLAIFISPSPQQATPVALPAAAGADW